MTQSYEERLAAQAEADWSYLPGIREYMSASGLGGVLDAIRAARGDPSLTDEEIIAHSAYLTAVYPSWLARQGGQAGATPPAGQAGAAYPAGQTAAQRAATMLYNAMRGLPFMSAEFLSALQAGQAPAPRTVTPQTLAALAADSTLSDAFFSVIRGNALYPESYLAEIGRYLPKGAAATPSFI